MHKNFKLNSGHEFLIILICIVLFGKKKKTKKLHNKGNAVVKQIFNEQKLLA